MRLFNKVGIVGVGLIGGSIALGLKKKRLANEVMGISRHKKTLLIAKKIHAIDKGSKDLNIIRDADLVILATPVSTILGLAPKISKIIKKECIVTDVGSTKQEIVARLSKIFPRFIGSHPLVGSEKRGIAFAQSDLFKDSLCIVTSWKNTDKVALAKIKKMWQGVGAKIANLAPHQHDKILSYVSHLPHLIAFSLMRTIPRRYLGFAASGLKDTTRIAASDNQIWKDIFLSNQKNMLRAIKLFQQNLAQTETAIHKKDTRLLIKILKEAKQRRANLN